MQAVSARPRDQVDIITGDITNLRAEMEEQERRHNDGIGEIQLILDDLLQKQVISEMRKQVEQEIAGLIDELVQEQVAECLKIHIPKELQVDVAQSRRELEEARLALHNSESRRCNSTLRSSNREEPLKTIYTRTGVVSDKFPKDLEALFNLDARTAKALMEEYEIPDVCDVRGRNLNRFMLFCGVPSSVVG